MLKPGVLSRMERKGLGFVAAYLSSDPVLAMVLEGDGAVLIRASASAESAEREIGLFSSPCEIVDWKDGNGGWI
jgi:hypothetical protein